MADDEFEDLLEERTKALGFRPQKEIAINNLLPYADQLDDESARLFAQIKTNFGKAVMLREMKPACLVWSARLIKYLRIYGLKFSKEDHIALVKLVYELMLIPDLEPNKVHKFATLFIMLTKKRYLISPEELTLQWRPLYDLGNKLFEKSRSQIGMFHFLTDKRIKDNEENAILNMIRKFLSGTGLDDTLNFFGHGVDKDHELPESLESSYYTLVRYAKPYFEPSATQEILDVCLPEILPWVPAIYLLKPLTAFLPVTLPPSQAALGPQLWFDKMMDLWKTCGNAHCGISEVLVLFASLAKRSPGAIDWTPHMANMFTRFLHAMNLPVSYKDMQYSRTVALDSKSMATLIVWTISPDGLVLKHLKSFLSGISSYLHSANTGRWSYKLKSFLGRLCAEFLNRVRREKEKQFLKSWENKTPDAYKLREEDITEFVETVLESILLALHSSSGHGDVSSSLHNLAILRPAIVIPPLLEKLRTSLESLTEPHRLISALHAVSAVARPMLVGATGGYPEGPTHVAPLLMAALPGIDLNDMKKTLSTLQFILIFSWMVPYIDCSSASVHWPDLTEEELLTCESTAQFEDFILIFLERIFNVIESSTQEHVRLETKESDSLRSKLETVIEAALFAATSAVLMQCSPKIFREALRKFKQFALNTNFEPNVAGSLVGVLLKVFARVDSEATLAAFVPQLCDELNDLLAPDETLLDENPPRELLYRLQLLGHAVECNGVVLVKYIPKIMPVLDRGLKQHSREAIGRTAEILGHIMTSLSIVELREYKSIKKDYEAAPKEWLPIRDWGRGCYLKDAQFDWHVPTEGEVECVQMLLDRYVKPELSRLDLWLTDERPMCPDRRLRSFLILISATSCSTLLPQPKEDSVPLVRSLVPATSFPLATGVTGEVTLDGKNVRVVLTRYLRNIQTKLLEHQSDDIRCFELLIQLWERVSGVRPSRSGPSLEARIRTYATLERAFDCRGGTVNFGRIRTLLADAVRLQDEARFDPQSEAGITNNGLIILKALFELGVNTYTSVRLLAQVRLYWMLSHYAYSYKALLPMLRDLLLQGGEGDEWHARHKGALYIMLGPKSLPLVAKQDWEVTRLLWPLIMDVPLSEKQSILRLEQAFSETLHRQFPTVNTTLTINEGSIEAAKAIVPAEELANPMFLENLRTAKVRESEVGADNVRLYNELQEHLVSIAESPTIIWRRLQLIMMLLTYCPSLQTPYTPSVVRLVVNSLVHDDIFVRKIAVRVTNFILKQRKIKVKKVKVSPYDIAGIPKPDKIVPGYRPDNAWAMWSEEGIPQNDEEWDRPWLRTPNCGFYAWPDQLEVAAPSHEQDCLNRKPEDMEEGERYIYENFTNDEFVEKLVKFFTVEEKRGKDKFSCSRFGMFSCVFRCFGYRVAGKFLKHALKHAGESQEASQRFACEIAAAAIKAPRYWDRASALAMYDEAIEVLKVGLSNVTPETMDDWGQAVATAVDKLEVHRAAPVFKAIMQIGSPQPTDGSDADADQQSSFGVCARLFVLQGALNGMMWRGAPLAAELLHRLEAACYIQHPYQNVREKVGSMLVTIFDTELVFPGGSAGPAPRFADFINSVKPKLAVLYDKHGEIVIKSSATAAPVPCETEQRPSMSRSPEPELCTGETLVAVANITGLPPDSTVTDDTQPQEEGNDEHSAAKCLPLIAHVEKGLVERFQTDLQLGGDAAVSGPREHARAINLLTTVLRASMGLIARSINGCISSQYEWMRTACALSGRGSPLTYDELSRAADGFLAALAMTEHTDRDFDAALHALEHVSTTRSWWARLACVEFAQPLLFYGLPMLCQEPQRAVRAEKFALKLMHDSRLEVRRAAAKLLTGLMHCKALPDEDSTLEKLMNSCRSKLIVERHCGVLGLCAYIASRPYSLGPRIGVVLAELSRHTNAPDPVPSAIRTALADFRRTHQDDWPKHREALTEQELDLLADLTSPPSYCA